LDEVSVITDGQNGLSRHGVEYFVVGWDCDVLRSALLSVIIFLLPITVQVEVDQRAVVMDFECLWLLLWSSDSILIDN